MNIPLEKFLESKIGNIDSNIADIKKVLEKINGRLNAHDEDIAALELLNAQHGNNCPHGKDIEMLLREFHGTQKVKEVQKETDSREERRFRRLTFSLGVFTLCIMLLNLLLYYRLN